MVRSAEALVGLHFTDAELDMMLAALQAQLADYGMLRQVTIPHQVPPALRFSPLLPGRTVSPPRPVSGTALRTSQPVRRPTARADLAFMTVAELAELLRTRQVTSVELTRLYLERLDRYDPVLHCVVTLTKERALRQAAEADRAIAAGNWRGPLHGIPYGVKDTLAVDGYPTTWGVALYRDRILHDTATVVRRLDAAGAVLVAKLAMGELGLNDIWFAGQVKNPWDPTEGAGGSSGGSAAAVAAGLVGFALGTETVGSIITPSSRNGATGLRPTFGRVSRHGCMPLCWSLDKIGPIARSAEDCALVLEAIAGPDSKDPTVVAGVPPFDWTPGRPLSSVRVGYFKAAFDAPRPGKARDDAALQALRRLGVAPQPVDLPTDLPVNSLAIIMAEAAAAFDELTRSDRDAVLREQHPNGWPNLFRAARFIPAVEYLQAQRVRTMLMERLDAVFQNVDVFMAPTFGVIRVTNLTGHPAIVVPNGFESDGTPASISFVGKLFGEAELCTVASAWQQATHWQQRHPRGFTE
jgi:Asp-tRNA(Asn)/Glu-tRNA(Gln) amidotransferase A subunit family amidase